MGSRDYKMAATEAEANEVPAEQPIYASRFGWGVSKLGIRNRVFFIGARVCRGFVLNHTRSSEAACCEGYGVHWLCSVASCSVA